MEESAHTFITTLPLLILIGLGYILRKTSVLTVEGIVQIKKLILDVSLPLVLFSTFLSMDIKTGSIPIFLIVLAILALQFLLGFLFQRPFGNQSTFPFLVTGVEFGMLGIPLFGTVYGASQLGAIGIFGLPHALFIWFIYATQLKRRFEKTPTVNNVILAFIRNPIIIAILLGILLNVSGAGDVLRKELIFVPLFRSIQLIGNILAPLVLLVVGFGLEFSSSNIVKILPVLLFRYGIALAIGLALAPWLIEDVLGLNQVYTDAMIVCFILPPPFIIPLHIPTDRKADLAFANNTISAYTILSILTIIIYFGLNPV